MRSSPFSVIVFEVKTAFGCASVLKKSSECRWPSRSALPVETEAMSMVASTVESTMDSPVVTFTSKVENEPLTFEMARWRTEKVSSEWVGSLVQVPAT